MRYIVKKDSGSTFAKVVDTTNGEVVRRFSVIRGNGWDRAENVCRKMNDLEPSKVGGKRDGAGRPAPLGRKETCTVRLTPDVAEFCRQHPGGFPVLEEKLRKSKEFREWLASRKSR